MNDWLLVGSLCVIDCFVVMDWLSIGCWLFVDALLLIGSLRGIFRGLIISRLLTGYWLV